MDISLILTLLYYVGLGALCVWIFGSVLIGIGCLVVIFIVEALAFYGGAILILGDDLNAIGFSLTEETKAKYEEKLKKIMYLAIGILVVVPPVVILAFKFLGAGAKSPQAANQVAAQVGGALRKLLKNRR